MIHVHAVGLAVILVLAGVAFYANALLAPAGKIRNIINVVILLFAVIFILMSLGAIGNPGLDLRL